ncbi:MAG: hypothetical protein NTX49_10665, partial [Chlamydiae bacterium]|nr:hypothetical protein [Chlamydiota bacterium]
MLCKTVEEAPRKNIELHADSAKKRISAQTGFLHLFTETPSSTEQSTIPLLENMYYVLGLFRTRLSDPIIEGKLMLEKLLAFEVEGNFPIYLHHFPSCKDRSLSLHMLPVFYYLLQDYRQVLGKELTRKLEDLTARIVTHAEKIREERPLPFAAEVKFLSFTKQLAAKLPASSQEWGEYLLALHMSEDVLLIQQELKKAASFWNAHLGVYIGEGRAHPQDGYFPKATLFDLFMAVQTGAFSEQLLTNQTLWLSGSLVHAFSLDAPLSFNDDHVAFLSHPEGKSRISFFWKENERLRSMSLDAPHGILSTEKTEQGIKISFTYPEEIPGEENEVEIGLYLDSSKKVALLVNGAPGSTFALTDTVVIASENSQIPIKISLVEGEGRLYGQLSKA